MSPSQREGGHIAFAADPVGNGPQCPNEFPELQDHTENDSLNGNVFISFFVCFRKR